MSYNFVHEQLKNGTNLICFRYEVEIWNIGVTKNELIYNFDTLHKNINNSSF